VAGDIIFHNYGAQWKDTPSYCDFLRGFFFMLFAERISEAAMGRTAVWGHNMFDKYETGISLCDWGEGKNILFRVQRTCTSISTTIQNVYFRF
jgi:hypothetical protein